MTVKRRMRLILVRTPGAMTVVRLTLETINASMKYRVTGLAAEAAFYMLLSLPPLVLGLFGGVGYVGNVLGPDTVKQVAVGIEEYALRFLTPSTVTEIVMPTIDDVLKGGRAELVSVGFLLSIWSGSRAINVFVDTISIMYGQKDVRGIVHMRAVSIVIYLAGMVAAIVLLPLVLIGPELLTSWLPDQLDFLGGLYWPAVLVLSVVVLTLLYQVSMPLHAPLWRDVPGALLALLIWLLASVVVRAALGATLGSSSTIFGPLSTPIVLLIWLYALAIAILIGAGLNAATRIMWPVRLHESTTSVLLRRARARLGLGNTPPPSLPDEDAGVAGGGSDEDPSLPAETGSEWARDQQFEVRERSAFAGAIERELAREMAQSRDERDDHDATQDTA